MKIKELINTKYTNINNDIINSHKQLYYDLNKLLRKMLKGFIKMKNHAFYQYLKSLHNYIEEYFKKKVKVHRSYYFNIHN